MLSSYLEGVLTSNMARIGARCCHYQAVSKNAAFISAIDVPMTFGRHTP